MIEYGAVSLFCLLFTLTSWRKLKCFLLKWTIFTLTEWNSVVVQKKLLPVSHLTILPWWFAICAISFQWRQQGICCKSNTQRKSQTPSFFNQFWFSAAHQVEVRTQKCGRFFFFALKLIGTQKKNNCMYVPVPLLPQYCVQSDESS